MRLKKLYDFSDEDFAMKFCHWAEKKFPSITFSHEEECTVQASEVSQPLKDLAEAFEAGSRSQCK